MSEENVVVEPVVDPVVEPTPEYVAAKKALAVRQKIDAILTKLLGHTTVKELTLAEILAAVK